MTPSIYSDLIATLKTTQDVTYFLSEIDTIKLTFFKSEELSLQKTLNSIDPDSAKKILEFFSKNNLDINDKEIVSDFFETLKELIKKLKVIKLVLAFDPNYNIINNIYNFVKETVASGYILDIEVSQDLLGGAIVIFNGKYNDFTLKKEIEETFADKNEILKLIHSDSR